jgi:hypothetical protein
MLDKCMHLKDTVLITYFVGRIVLGIGCQMFEVPRTGLCHNSLKDLCNM